MNKNEAEIYFAKYLRKPCPECPAAVGTLCDTEGVWVHLDRLKSYDPLEDLDKAVELLRLALNLRIHGEDPHTGTWSKWDGKCEEFLRSL